MKSIYYMSVVLCTLGRDSVTHAQDIYKGVEKRGYAQPQVNHHPNPVFNHQAPQQHVPTYPRPHGRPYPPYGVQRPQVAIVTPHVGIYVDPQPAVSYQKTEEVYLPYGGTYKSVTEYIPQSSVYPAQPQRRVIRSGYYDAENQQ